MLVCDTEEIEESIPTQSIFTDKKEIFQPDTIIKKTITVGQHYDTKEIELYVSSETERDEIMAIHEGATFKKLKVANLEPIDGMEFETYEDALACIEYGCQKWIDEQRKIEIENKIIDITKKEQVETICGIEPKSSQMETERQKLIDEYRKLSID